MNTSTQLAMGVDSRRLRSAPCRLAVGIAVLALGWPAWVLA